SGRTTSLPRPESATACARPSDPGAGIRAAAQIVMGTAEHQLCVMRICPPDRACDRSGRRIADIAQGPQGNPGLIFRSFPEGLLGLFLPQPCDDSRITGLHVRRRGNATCATTPAGGRSRRSLVAWSRALRMPTSYRLWRSHASGGERSPEEIPTCFFSLRG